MVKTPSRFLPLESSCWFEAPLVLKAPGYVQTDSWVVVKATSRVRDDSYSNYDLYPGVQNDGWHNNNSHHSHNTGSKCPWHMIRDQCSAFEKLEKGPDWSSRPSLSLMSTILFTMRVTLNVVHFVYGKIWPSSACWVQSESGFVPEFYIIVIPRPRMTWIWPYARTVPG